jgi:F-type H+-transporting ATPase subunit gamma
MASAKDLKKKIRSISNTKKITRTMELVATAKSKRAQDRVKASTPYSGTLAEILESLARAGTVKHPLLEVPEKPGPAVIFVISANRGLCGGYNTNLVAMAERTIRQEEKAGHQVEVYMAGRKGISKFRFLRIPVAKTFVNLDDRASFADAEKVAADLMNRFLAGEVEKIVVISTRYYSAGVQKPAVTQLLPIVPPKAEGGPGKAPPGRERAAVDYLYEPDPESILGALLPLSVKTAFYRLILEAVTSEQIARRLAMKVATDNAEEMIRQYTRFYNRTRQAGITQQINEIVSGANALE